jgi:hypothetical protein
MTVLAASPAISTAPDFTPNSLRIAVVSIMGMRLA